MLHHRAINSIWKEEGLPPFTELIISWNANRPSRGRFLFYASIKTDRWSPWLLYASWGNEGQKSFKDQTGDIVQLQDTFEIKQPAEGTGFRVKIEAEGNADLEDIRSLHAYVRQEIRLDDFWAEQKFIRLPIQGLSQMQLDHPRNKDMCSPATTAAVVRFLAKDSIVDPVRFAEQAWDSGFDIYGNWVFSVAQASAILGPSWECWAERLGGFADIYKSLLAGIPTIISVKGPLPGGALPYANGHLMAVIGYDPAKKLVLCMDPAFPSDDRTCVSYHLSGFLEAWNRRGRIAYIFKRSVCTCLAKPRSPF